VVKSFPGLLTRLATRLLPGIRRSGPRRHVNPRDRDVPFRSPQHGYELSTSDGAPVNRPGLVQPVDARPALSTGVGIALVVAGAILRFAVAATFAHVLNAHVAGVIVMLAGVFALLLSLLVWGPLNRRRSRPAQDPRPRRPRIPRLGRGVARVRTRHRMSAANNG